MKYWVACKYLRSTKQVNLTDLWFQINKSNDLTWVQCEILLRNVFSYNSQPGHRFDRPWLPCRNEASSYSMEKESPSDRPSLPEQNTAWGFSMKSEFVGRRTAPNRRPSLLGKGERISSEKTSVFRRKRRAHFVGKGGMKTESSDAEAGKGSTNASRKRRGRCDSRI